jgi:hypothetical protein
MMPGHGSLPAMPGIHALLEMESSARRCTVVWRKATQIGVQFG